MKYLFILGRNTELSEEELKSFFEKEKINFRIISLVKNGLLAETEKIPGGITDKLGGVISVGEVLATGDIPKELDKKTLYMGKSNKLNYVLFNFNGKDFEDIQHYLKRRFREEKLKATEKKLTGRISLQSGENAFKVSSNLIDEQYFVFEDNFGRIIETCDYEAIEKRDMGKPVRREALSVSPRLAKILVNLSQVKEGEILLDPFCGIGAILQEALLQNIKVIGIDKDKIAINNARLNIKWFGFKEKDYKLINGDSSKIKIQEVKAIATEPELGELQKKIPSQERAKEIIGNFEKLMIMVLNNLKNKVKGRIVFTSPLILIGKKRVSCDFERISSETGLRIVKGFPINEFRENSIIGRSIIIMEK